MLPPVSVMAAQKGVRPRPITAREADRSARSFRAFGCMGLARSRGASCAFRIAAAFAGEMTNGSRTRAFRSSSGRRHPSHDYRVADLHAKWRAEWIARPEGPTSIFASQRCRGGLAGRRSFSGNTKRRSASADEAMKARTLAHPRSADDEATMTDGMIRAVAKANQSTGKMAGLSEDDALQFARAAVSAHENFLANSGSVIVHLQAKDAVERDDRDIARSLKQSEADHTAVKPRLARIRELTSTNKR